MSQMAVARGFHGGATLEQHDGRERHPISTCRGLTWPAVP